MDDALRQRLVGAAVIIALAVIFVPMLLDSPDEVTRTQQVDLTIPPRSEPGVVTRRLPLDPDMTAPTPAPETALDNPPADVAEPLPGPDGGGVAVLTDVPAKPVPTSAAAEPVAVTPPVAAPVAAPAKPVAAPTAAPAAPAAPSPAKGGRFLAQFGSYADRNNADALVRDLAKAGVPADIETLTSGGRPLHRVRSKPYATRTEADAARLGAQRQIAGLASTVIELAAANATQSTPARPNLSGWAVQVGVFSKKEGAEELAARLRAGGYAAFVEPVKLAGGQTSHRVRIGPEVRRENAQRIQNEVKSKFKLDALVVAHP